LGKKTSRDTAEPIGGCDSDKEGSLCSPYSAT